MSQKIPDAKFDPLAINTERDLARVDKLAFADRKELRRLLVLRPALHAAAQKPAQQRSLALFGILLEMALQGNSAHPSEVTALASAVADCIQNDKYLPRALAAWEKLLVGPDGTPTGGDNSIRLAAPDEVIAHEHQRMTGGFEVAYRAKIKYRAQQARIKKSADWAADWAYIKQTFPVDAHWDRHGIIRRSPNPEYNWRKRRVPNLGSDSEAFQITFDLFCWKWFLWGMRGDEPLVEQLFYAFTPYGTQIFIPGYWSLDPVRDIKWAEIKRLHAARGLHRQGEKMSQNQSERQKQIALLQKLDAEARKLGLKGEKRHLYIINKAGLSPQMDRSQLNRLLKAARYPTDFSHLTPSL